MSVSFSVLAGAGVAAIACLFAGLGAAVASAAGAVAAAAAAAACWLLVPLLLVWLPGWLW